MAKLNDKETQSIANVVSDVLEGKTKEEGYGKKKIKSGYGEEVKYPHDMYHPETGAKVVAKTEKDHEELSKKGYTHEKPVKEGPEEPRAEGEKEFKKKHVIKKSGENPDGTVTKEDTKASKSLKTHKVEKEPSNSKEVKETKRELTDEQKYKEFFASALKKYGVESPQELDKEKRKEFFNYVDKNYKAKSEDVNEVLGTVKKAAKSALDKINPKKRAEKREKIEDIKKEILRHQKMDQQHGQNLDKKEAEFKAGKIDKERMDKADDYHTTAMYTHNQEIEKLKDQLKKLQQG